MSRNFLVLGICFVASLSQSLAPAAQAQCDAYPPTVEQPPPTPTVIAIRETGTPAQSESTGSSSSQSSGSANPLGGTQIPSGLTASSGSPPAWYGWWLFQQDRYHRTGHLLPSRQERPSGSLARPYDIERARAIGALVAALGDRKPDVRRAAVLALGKIARPKDAALKRIQALLGDPKKEVRRAATLALGLLNQPQAQKLLRGLLRASGTNRRLRAYALVGLGFTPEGSQLVLPTLRNS
ncbi:HEAT repeat domain-containing protein, partial [bacterium AH-315-M10]|nr:HEAT repeat domain-containing protein [bacterium AH-315-M10]